MGRPPGRSLVVAAAGVVLVAGCASDDSVGELVLFASLTGGEGASRIRTAATELTPERGFDALGLSGPASVSGNPELAELAGDVRRFGFVLAGCRHDSARLSISDGVAHAELLEDGRTAATPVCAVPRYFLAVFDVPAEDVPSAVLVG